jgi:membrane associated rhomboid family serine protease
MLVLPLGLVSKNQEIPIVTYLIMMATIVYSVVYFSLQDQARDLYYHGTHRKEYSLQAQKFVQDTCYQKQSQSFCRKLKDLPQKTYLLFENNNRNHWALQRVKDDGLSEYIHQTLSQDNLQKNNPLLLEKKEASKQELKDFVRSKSLLSPHNMSLTSALRSLFLHGGLIHLLSNLFILLFLAAPVEERMGGGLFALTYLGAGIIGSTLHVFIQTDAFYILGASSAVSGIAGAFTLLFWHNHAKVFVSFFFIFNKVIHIPVYIYSPLFFVASDLGGSINGGSEVAHLAHLGGFFVGMLVALGFNQLVPMPRHFTYPYELRYLAYTRNQASPLKRVRGYMQWLYHAPGNIVAFKEFINEYSKSCIDQRVTREVSHFRKTHFNQVYHYNRGRLTFLKLMPVSWLASAPSGDDPAWLEKNAHHFVETRDFKNAFKTNFLLLNEMGWDHASWRKELIKNGMKAGIDKGFKADLAELMQEHTTLRHLLTKDSAHDFISA